MFDRHQYLNKIELVGVVGNIGKTKVADDECARISVATCYAYKDKEGNAVIETTWHNCVAWASKHPIVSELSKGDKVHIIGRLRAMRYTDAEGNERTTYETIVGNLEKVTD